MTAPMPSIAGVQARLAAVVAECGAIRDGYECSQCEEKREIICLLDAVRPLLERYDAMMRQSMNAWSRLPDSGDVMAMCVQECGAIHTLLAPAPTDGGSVQSPNKESP